MVCATQGVGGVSLESLLAAGSEATAAKKRGTTMKLAAGVVFIYFGIAVLLSSALQAQKPAVGLSGGMWSGQATGADAKSYSVTVTLDGTGAGFVEYPSMKCGGRLQFVRKSGDTFSYREKITHGQAKCGPAGQVDMVPNGSQLIWTRSAGGTKATATLTSVDNPGPNGCASCELDYDQAIQACIRVANSDERQKCQDRAEDDLQTCEGACQQ
jgi:hypothetical protein